MSEQPLNWFDGLRRECSYIEALDDEHIVRLDLPEELQTFLERFGRQEIDGLLIGGHSSLHPDLETATQETLIPFACERHGSDLFCLNSKHQVVRWFHDGQCTGKILAPHFKAFLLHRCLLLCDRPEAFGEGEEATVRADSWATLLRQKLCEEGADLSDPWWPVWPQPGA